VLCLLAILLTLNEVGIDWIEQASLLHPLPGLSNEPVLHFLLEARLLNFPIFYVDDLN
jgi:hypothetical protein